MDKQKQKELEEQIISIAMNDEKALDEILEIARPEYFSDKRLRKTFEIISTLKRNGINPDYTAVWLTVEKNGLAEIVKESYLRTIDARFVASINVKFLAVSLQDEYLRRKLNEEIERVKSEIKEKSDAFFLINSAIDNLRRLTEMHVAEADGEHSLGEELDEFFEEIKIERESGIIRGFESKIFPSFNDTGGIRRGNYVIISGKYKRGKTTFSAALALDFAMQGYGVGFISIEMPKKSELYPKFISMATGTRYQYLRNPSAKNKSGRFSYSEERFQETIAKAKTTLGDKKIFVAEKTFSSDDIGALIRRWVDKQGVDFVFIDYIQLVRLDRGERKELELTEFSNEMKRLAKELDIVIVALAQENDEGRTANARGLPRDADFWFSVTRPIKDGAKTLTLDKGGQRYKIEVDSSMFQITLEESRHSVSGWTFLAFLKSNGEFVELDYTRLNEIQTKAEPF